MMSTMNSAHAPDTSMNSTPAFPYEPIPQSVQARATRPYPPVPRYETRHHSHSFVMARQIVKRRRGRPRKDGTVCKQRLDKCWTPDETRALIEHWKEQEVLYSQKHKQYHDKEARQQALRKMKLGLQEKGISASEQQIFEKLISLRSYYCSQLSKIEAAKASGNEYYESNWKYFQDLSFLSANVIPRKSEMVANFREASQYLPQPYNDPHASFPMGQPVIVTHEPYGPPPPHPYSLPGKAVPIASGHPELAIKPESHLQRKRFHVHSPPEFQPRHSPSSQQSKSPVPPLKPRKNVMSDYDEMFGSLIATMIGEIDECEQKDQLKIEIQKMIVKRKYSSDKQKHCGQPVPKSSRQVQNPEHATPPIHQAHDRHIHHQRSPKQPSPSFKDAEAQLKYTHMKGSLAARSPPAYSRHYEPSFYNGDYIQHSPHINGEFVPTVVPLPD